MSGLSFTVPGIAAPQGSKRHVGHGIMVESSARLKPWRAAVTAAAAEARAGHPTITGPVVLGAVFSFPRPAGHYGTGRNAGVVRDSAPSWPSTRKFGDLSKLVRAVEDAITDAGVWQDDCQVVAFGVMAKVWAPPGESPSTRITIRESQAIASQEVDR